MLIWGWQKRVYTLAMITLVCGRCGNPAAHALRRLVTKFTLFFIPLFPLSTKHFLECTWCGASSPIAVPQIPDLLARANAETMSPGQYQRPGPTGPNANWPQQPTLGTTDAHRQQPTTSAPAAHWQQPALGTANAQYQQPAPSAPNTHWQQQPAPGAPNTHWQQR